MAVPKFSPAEMKIVREEVGMMGVITPVFNYPCTMKEAVQSMYKRKPYWVIYGGDAKMMSPSINPDNIARGFCFEADAPEPIVGRGVPDMFGIEWEYIPQVKGAMVRPGKPFAEDAHDLLKKTKWPEPDKWDWAASGAKNNGTFLKTENYNNIMFLNGWFERLISMLDFEGALMAMYDEDQKDAVHEFFTKLTDTYINIFGHMIDTYPEIDGFSIHDDWGSQKETFFSPALVREMIVPHMRRVTDYLHSRGKNCELHSCGKNLKQVPNMIEAGWDAWFPQSIVDSQEVHELYGDKLLIGVDPKLPEGLSDEEYRAAARLFVDKFMQPGKECFHGYITIDLPVAYREEMYEYSRKKLAGE